MNFLEMWNDIGTNCERLIRKRLTRLNSTISWYCDRNQ